MQVGLESPVRRVSRWSAWAVMSAAAAVVLPQTGLAQTRTFTGGGDGTTYSQPANWSPPGAPNPANVPDTAAEDAVIDPGGAFGVNLDITTTIGDLTLGGNDTLTFLNGRSLTVAGGDINNSGAITLASAGSFTDLFTNGTALNLTGTGTLTLQNAARILGSGTFTNNSTIQGETSNGGTIGNNTLSLVNTGLINANSATALALVLDPAATVTSLTNTGTMQASNGGLLQLTGASGGVFNNGGGTVQALTGSTVQLVGGASIIGGTLAASGTGVIRVNNGTFTNLTSTANVTVANNTGLSLVGTIANSGTIVLNSTGSFTDLNGGGATLTGTGTITLQNAARILGSGTFTTSNTIQGETSNSGGIGNNTLSIVNSGLINANVSGLALVIDPANSITGLTNSGTLQASNGGILQLTGNAGGAFTNSGTVQALTGSTVQLVSGAGLVGGTLATSGTGGVSVNNGTFTNLTSTASVTVVNSSTLSLAGTIANTGTILLNSTGGFTDLSAGGATLNGNGTVTLQNAARLLGSGTFTTSNTIQGETSNGGSIGNNTLSIVNSGLINANSATGLALVIDPANTATGLTNSGTLRASNGGLLRLSGNAGGAFTNTGTGGIEALAGSTVELASGAGVVGGTLSTAGTGLINVTGGQLTDLTLAGNARVANGGNLTLVGTIANSGTLDVNSTGSFTDVTVTNATLTGSGTITLRNADRLLGSGTFTTSNTIQGETFNGGSVGNNTLNIVNSGLIDANVAAAGTFLLIDPAAANGLTNTATGVLRASGGGKLVLTGSAGGVFTNNGLIRATGAGSEVQLAAGASVSGTIQSDAGGLIRNTGGTTLNNVTLNGDLIANNGQSTTVVGTLTNNGTVDIISTGSFTDLTATNATLAGTGTLTLRNADRILGSGTFTNNSSIQGETSNSGSLGNNTLTLVNGGLINANAAGLALNIDPGATGGFTNSAGATLRASNGGQALLNGSAGGSFTNNGTFEALNGSTLTFNNGAVLTNSSGGTLTGGVYRSVATGAGTSTLNLPGGNITTNAADVTISGTGSTFAQINSITSTVTGGAFRVLDGRNFTAAGNYTNTGVTQLGGGTFTATTAYNNLTQGETFGFGTLPNRVTNSGLVRASGGTLSVGGIDAATTAGTARSDPGATLNLSASTAASTVAVLDNNGSLNLGAQNVLVRSDYTNANFGVGNAFNPRANVTGTGQINASPAVTQTINGATNGTTATPSIDFRNIRVGTANDEAFSIGNTGASGSPSLRGAIQTTNAAGFGGNITDPRLSGTGVTPQNFGPIAAGGNSSSFLVLFTATTAGPLTGQKIAVVNNFDNVADQQINLIGAAYNPAVASVTPNPTFVGNFRVGDAVPGSTITFANTAPAGAFSEDLGVSNVAATGTAALGAGSPTAFSVIAGGSNTAVKAAVSTATAGAKSGTITATLASAGTVNGVAVPDLSPLSRGTASVAVTGNVYRLATAAVATPVNLGDRHVGDAATGTIVVTNTAMADGFSDALAATVTGFAPAVAAAGGTAAVAPGGTSGPAITATLDTATAGAKSGTVTVGLTSTNAAAGLADVPLPSQTATVTANVFNLAGPQITVPQPINFGIVHVGDSVTPRGVTIKNNAPAGSFSENLNAAPGTPGPGVTVAGAFGGLAAQASTNAISVGLDTATARVINSTLPIAFVSDGTGINSLGQTALPGQLVSVTATVNNFAAPLFAKTAGDGTLTGGPTAYTLDFGTVNEDTADPQATLRLTNGVLAPADFLAGSYVISGTQFSTSGFTPFNGLAAGASLGDLLISLDTDLSGTFGGSIVLSPRSQNASGFDGALSTITINLQGIVAPVPEPATLAVLSLAGYAGLRRRTPRTRSTPAV